MPTPNEIKQEYEIQKLRKLLQDKKRVIDEQIKVLDEYRDNHHRAHYLIGIKNWQITQLESKSSPDRFIRFAEWIQSNFFEPVDGTNEWRINTDHPECFLEVSNLSRFSTREVFDFWIETSEEIEEKQAKS